MSVQVHRCRFMDTERSGVSSIAFNAQSLGPKNQVPVDLRMAIGRANGDMEIWAPNFTSSSIGPASTANVPTTGHFLCEFVIPGAKGRSVEDLCWVRSPELRLFSVGATDTVVEWDIQTGLPSQFVRSDAGVVWAISVSPDQQKLAAATETGHVIVYDISEDGKFEFLQRLGGADTSLACLTWVSNSKIAAGGSDGKIRVWSLDQQRIVQTLRVDKQKFRAKGASTKTGGASTAEEDTIVWTLKVLPGTQQLVSGDSNGFVKIWDLRSWSLHQSFQAHEGDVLCLATNYNDTALFSSGLDQKIVQARLTSQDAKSRKWTLMNSLVAHTHDIRCMASYQTGNTALLVSGGLEPGFVVSSITEFTTRPHRRVLPSRIGGANVEITTKDGETYYITEFSGSKINLWRMRNGVRQLQTTIKTNGDEFLTSVSYDPELGLLAAGSLYQLKLFLVEGNGTKDEGDDSDREADEAGRMTDAGDAEGKGFVSALPVPNWPEDQGVKHCKWAEPEKLVVVTDQDEVLVYDTNSSSVISEITDQPERKAAGQLLPYTNAIALLAVGEGLVAVARYSRMIDVYTLQGKLVTSLPSTTSEITAMSFRNPTRIVVALADQSILEFDTTTGLLTPWSRLNMGRMPAELASQPEPTVGIFSGVGGADRVWFWAPSWLATIDFSSTSALRKRRQHEDENDTAVVEDLGGKTDDLPAFWISTKYKPLFFAGALGSDLLISEREEKSSGVKKFWSNRRIQL